MHEGYTGEWDKNWHSLSPEEKKIRLRIYETIHSKEVWDYYTGWSLFWHVIQIFVNFYAGAALIVLFLNWIGW
jgi:hypothetical protein